MQTKTKKVTYFIDFLQFCQVKLQYNLDKSGKKWLNMVKGTFSKGRYNLMDLTCERRKELETIVQNYCQENNLNVSDDLFKELGKLGFSIYNAKFKKPLAGMIFVNENIDKIDEFNSNKVIIYNAALNFYEIRFTVLHELAHYISRKYNANGGNVLFAVRDHNERYHNDINEQEKDFMAAAMLIPRESLQKDISQYLNKDFSEIRNNKDIIEQLKEDNSFIGKIQRIYKVDEILAKRRIDEITDDAVI